MSLTNQSNAALPVAVLGAGPVGLAAVAQLIARGLPFVALEAAPSVGAHLLDYGHVRLFSPWRYNIDAQMARQLAASGWQAPDAEALPLAGEVVERVLKPFAALPEVARGLRLNTRATAISREGFDKVKSAGREHAPFVIRAEQGGRPLEIRARAVIDATGTWGQPNPLGAGGLPALGEAAAAAQIHYGIPDVLDTQRARYAGKRTLVVGAGHSAANALLALAELAQQVPGTRLAWGVRSTRCRRAASWARRCRRCRPAARWSSSAGCASPSCAGWRASSACWAARRRAGRCSWTVSTRSSAPPGNAPTCAWPASCASGWTPGWNRPRRWAR